jgi:hypothetical protein
MLPDPRLRLLSKLPLRADTFTRLGTIRYRNLMYAK